MAKNHNISIWSRANHMTHVQDIPHFFCPITALQLLNLTFKGVALKTNSKITLKGKKSVKLESESFL